MRQLALYLHGYSSKDGKVFSLVHFEERIAGKKKKTEKRYWVKMNINNE